MNDEPSVQQIIEVVDRQLSGSTLQGTTRAPKPFRDCTRKPSSPTDRHRHLDCNTLSLQHQDKHPPVKLEWILEQGFRLFVRSLGVRRGCSPPRYEAHLRKQRVD